MPTAVITESSENTMSSSRIWMMTPANEAAAALAVPFLAFQLLVDLVRALGDQEQAADEQDQVAAGDLVTEHGEQRRGQPHHPGDRPAAARCAMIIASDRPIVARARCSSLRSLPPGSR